MTDKQRGWLFVVSAPIACGLATMAGGAIGFLVMWWIA
jgi:hypothetical protein